VSTYDEQRVSVAAGDSAFLLEPSVRPRQRHLAGGAGGRKKLAVQKYYTTLISAIKVLENLKECRGLAGVAVA
jgi:hypothetical protein